MNGKDAIISKIINDSEALAKGILEEADIKVVSLIDSANTLAKDYRDKTAPQIENEKKAIIKRKESVADIEVKKIILNAKREMIDNIFSTAEEKINKMKSGDYLKFIKLLIEKYAQDGDKVIICKKDADIINDKFINEIAAEKKIDLMLSGTFGDFTGGIILSSKNFDKNLTLKTLLRQIKEKNITEIAGILFGQGV